MALTIPNLDKIVKDDPRLGEALTKVQSYTNQNVTPAAGNKVKPPSFLNPARTS